MGTVIAEDGFQVVFINVALPIQYRRQRELVLVSIDKADVKGQREL